MVIVRLYAVFYFNIPQPIQIQYGVLIGVIEFTQYQNYIITTYVNISSVEEEGLDVNDLNINLIEFPENIPTSAILSEIMEIQIQLHGNGTSTSFDDMYNLKKKAEKLYHKYIKTGSEFEINISWKQRNSLII